MAASVCSDPTRCLPCGFQGKAKLLIMRIVENLGKDFVADTLRLDRVNGWPYQVAFPASGDCLPQHGPRFQAQLNSIPLGNTGPFSFEERRYASLANLVHGPCSVGLGDSLLCPGSGDSRSSEWLGSVERNGAQPYGTISFAASMAQPGDVVIVHAGTYREWVKPPRGGTGDEKRIVYRAAPGEEVWIKGSERITSWTRLATAFGRRELPNAFFGDYNPYALKLSGGWLNYGQWHHRGDVYLDGEAFYENADSRRGAADAADLACEVDDQ